MTSERAEWDDVTIASLGEIVAGGTPSRATPSYWNGSIPWITPGEITELQDKYVRDTREKITKEGLLGSAAKLLPVGSLLVTTRATLGEVAIAAVPVATNQGFKSIIPNDATDSLFAYYLIRTLRSEMERLASGTTFLEISKADFARIRTRRPTPAVQSRIALALDRVDKAIAKADEVIAKLKRMRIGLLHDLLTCGIDENGELRDRIRNAKQFVPSAYGLVPKVWEIPQLSELIASAVDGPFGSNLKTEHYTKDPGVRVVRLQNIEIGRFNKNDRAYVSIAHAEMLKRHQVVPGDLLVASLGDANHPIGRACLYPDGFAAGIVKADCFRLRIKPWKALNAFVMLFLNCPTTRRELNVLGQGVTRDRVNLSTLLRLRVLRPSVEEQARIVQTLGAVDVVIEADERALDKLVDIRFGLTTDLLGGQFHISESILASEVQA